MESSFEQNELDRMRRDPTNYKWGFAYYNREDPRIILPKFNRWMGWTLNFARPQTYLILGVIAAFAIAVAILGK